MIVLGRLVEEIAGKPLSEFLGGIGVPATYEPDSTRCAPTSKAEPGVVHDPLARAYMTREHRSGNAGLFATGDELARFCQALLSGKLLKPRTVEEMFRPTGDTRGLGWDVFDDPPWKPGVGHTGYTGTLVWMDPATGRFAVVLTNRVYPDDKASVTRLRSEVLRAVNR